MQNLKLILIQIFLLLFSCPSMFAQNNITVSGTVKDGFDSEGLIGVNVMVKGATGGTITDMNGNYSLSVSPNSTLVFSYVGYTTQEIAVKNRTLIHVTLQSDTKDLDEIVIVGASLKKSDLTGSVGSVSQKVLEEKPVTSINEAMQGRVAGVLISNAARPDQQSSIKIRGINTINTGTDPIYVVDGLVMDNWGGGFNSINLNDVASVEVLKDASATALYGSRAANGVILITTKKGARGEGKVSYDGWFGVRSLAQMPSKMNSKQLFELRRDAAINGFNARNPMATDAQLQSFIADRVMTPYDPISKGGGFVFAQYELDAYNNPNFQDNDWLGEVTRDGLEQNHSLSFSGGNDRGSFYFSFGYSNKQGVVKNVDDASYTGRINADQNIKPWLKVGTNTQFTRSKANIFSDDGVFDKARGANPMLAIDYDRLELNYGEKPTDGNYFNPLRTLKIENERTRNRLITSNFLNINPIEGLNIRTSFSVDYWEEARFKYVPNDIQEAIRYAHHGENTHTRDSRTSWQWDNTITYDKKFDLHRINALLGTSTSHINRDYTEVTGRGYLINDFSYYNIGASYYTKNRSIGSDFTGSSLQSYIARVNYDYANKYYLTATARYDGSSKFAKNKRWGLFPSFSAAWNMAEEDFMKDQHLFDQLKFRVGYGSVGNQNIDDYAFYTLYAARVAEEETTFVPKSDSNGDLRRGNENLTWESQRQSNIGVDMAFLNNRIRLSADAFLIKNEDLLMKRTINITSGFKEEIVNIGSIENKGVEFSVNAKVIETKDFQWNVSANISADKNKVTKLYGDNDVIYKYDGDRNLQKEGNLFVGESRNTIYIWKTGGIAQAGDMDRLSSIKDWAGRSVNPGDLYPLDTNGDGVISELDRVIVGSTDPKFYGGFSTDFTYNGISLNAVFTYSHGAKKLSSLYESMTGSTGSGFTSTDLLDRWTPENTNAEFPRPILNDPQGSGSSYNTFSASQMDRSVQDASYLRLSALTLAYTLPKSIISKWGLSNLRLYSTASNLFCLTPYKGYDPEMGDWYPPTRMFVFGLNVSF